MKKIENKIQVGTKVFVNGEWCKITEVHETRNWIKTDLWAGSFQRNDIEKYSNK